MRVREHGRRYLRINGKRGVCMQIFFPRPCEFEMNATGKARATQDAHGSLFCTVFQGRNSREPLFFPLQLLLRLRQSFLAPTRAQDFAWSSLRLEIFSPFYPPAFLAA